MKLPAFLQPDPPEPANGSVIEPTQPFRQSVLLVDDEPAFRSLLAATLAQDGYQVIQAGDGEEAVEAIKKVKRVDLVVTDIRMPNVDGITMAQMVRQAQPGVPVLFITGYPDDVAQAVPNSYMLSKPFLREDLMMAVRHLTYAW